MWKHEKSIQAIMVKVEVKSIVQNLVKNAVTQHMGIKDNLNT